MRQYTAAPLPPTPSVRALASDLRADAPTFGAYDPMESLARGFA